jgi:hypothetical protein
MKFIRPYPVRTGEHTRPPRSRNPVLYSPGDDPEPEVLLSRRLLVIRSATA